MIWRPKAFTLLFWQRLKKTCRPDEPMSALVFMLLKRGRRSISARLACDWGNAEPFAWTRKKVCKPRFKNRGIKDAVVLWRLASAVSLARDPRLYDRVWISG